MDCWTPLYFMQERKKHNTKFITSGGRVLGVTALGNSIDIAQSKAYNIVEKIYFKNRYYRKDIGWRAIEYVNK
jgi:phosphoribosylamine---glycine ligase